MPATIISSQGPSGYKEYASGPDHETIRFMSVSRISRTTDSGSSPISFLSKNSLVLTVGEQQFNIITYDSWAVKFLRRRVAEGPFEYTGLNCTDSKIGFQACDLKSCVPAITREFRNDGHASGRIYYDNYWDGEIALYRDECSFASKTLIGNIASDDMERWQRLFEGANLSADRFNDCVKLSLAN